MAIGTLGRNKGRLCVATDRRLLLLGKWPLRPVRCESISIGHISSIRLTSNEYGGQLSFDGVDGPVRLEIMNVQRAEEIARALSTQVDRARVSIEHRPDAAGSLSLTACVVGNALVIVAVATWVAIGLWALDVLALIPGLAIIATGMAAQFGLRRSWRREREDS